MLPQPKPVNAFGVWAVEVNKALRSEALKRSPDSLTETTSTGTITKAKTLAKINPAFPVPAAYDKDESYSAGEFVYITNGDLGNDTKVPNGIWQCIKNVPSNKFETVSFLHGEPYKRTAGKNYYPQWPMPSDSDNHYWLLWAAWPIETNICADGTNKKFYVSMFEKPE